MEKIKRGLLFVLNLIDNGELLKTPIKWLYIVNGILPFIMPLAVFIAFLAAANFREVFGSIMSSMLFMVILFICTLICAYLSYIFWKKRREQFSQIISGGNKFIAIPIWAHVIRSISEWCGLYFSAIFGTSAVAAYLCTIFTGFHALRNVDALDVLPNSFVTFICSLIALAFVLFIIAIFGYLTILIGRFISERILIKAQIANDVRDIGDIHRAATMPQETNINVHLEEDVQPNDE